MSEYLSLQTVVNIVKLIQLSTDNTNNIIRPQLIDPISCMCKLAMLYFYPLQSRLSIKNHCVYIQEPSLLLGVKRYYYSDGREDISMLFIPIMKAIEWYLIDRESKIEENINRCDILKDIMLFSSKGLKKLQQTYSQNGSNNNVNLTLQLYIKYIHETLNNKMTLKEAHKIYSQHTYFVENEDELNSSKINVSPTVIDENVVKKQFSNDILATISSTLKLCDQTKNENCLKSYITSINALIQSQDDKFKDLILHVII
jgi:hypothetical protein